MNQINCKCGRTILPAKTRINVTCQCGCRYSKVNGGWVMMYDSYPRVSKKILSILIIGLLLISPSVAFAQDNGTPLPIETQADQLQQAADAAIAAAKAAVTAAQQAAQQASAAKAQAASARERANALDSQAALSRASDAERLADESARSAKSALSAAREALEQSARAVTALKEAQAAQASAIVAVKSAAANDGLRYQSLSDAKSASLAVLTNQLNAITVEASGLQSTVDKYQILSAALLSVIALLIVLSIVMARKSQPVIVPVTVSDTPIARTTIDNGTAEEVPGATIVLSQDMRKHIDRLIASAG